MTFSCCILFFACLRAASTTLLLLIASILEILINGTGELNGLGEEGGSAFIKNIAAYAGVQCRELCGVPWGNVVRAGGNLGLLKGTSDQGSE